ncbi:S8 family serine peptidase [Nocardioides sp. GXZ039]|uniref:S8 family serine peptidase n=1 Tax=Nocardioides sp. GXZ039 TaxID=3136018 RepID=UPI0030F4064E
MRLRGEPGLRAAATMGLLAATLTLAAPAPARAIDGNDCTQINSKDTPSEPATDPSEPMKLLQIDEAQEIARSLSGRAPGQGVGVAVIDSGVRDLAQLTPAKALRPAGFSTSAEEEYYHGTAVASVIAGQAFDGGTVGIAPAASIVDVKVYDADSDSDDLKRLTLDGVVAGLQEVLPDVGTGPGKVRIVNLSLSVPEDTPELKAAIDAVTDAGGIVVASSGNRPAADAPGSTLGAYEPGEDHADDVWPAGYAKSNPRVIAVGTTLAAGIEDAGSPPGVLNSAIDVVVPTYGAVAYAVNGTTCSLGASSTSVAAGEVSGILALLMSAFPDDTPDQTIARLESTTTGGSPPSENAPDKFRGRGIVQPVNALTSPIRPRPDGTVPGSTTVEQAVQPANVPEPAPDVLADTRRHALWWGLVGLGALVIAALLRPVLSRRR